MQGFYFCMEHTDKRHIHHFIIPLGASLEKGTPIEKIQVEVDPSTICQCTGLKDKNGKMIWDNDVIELYDRNTDYKWRAVVLFGNPNCEYTWGWQLKPIVECETNTDILCWIDMEESGAFCEVIGNIFDEGSENIGKGAEEN